MSIIEINIKDDGENWHKEIRLFGMTVYHRHDYSETNNNRRMIGFNCGQYCPGEVNDYDCLPEE